MVRHAFTMIELIFAIVIIGIISISIPAIMVNNARSVEQNLLQEAILIATTKMTQIVTFPWDESSRDPSGFTLAKTEVLDVVTGLTSELNRNTADFRVGHFVQPLRRRMTPSLSPIARNVTSVANLGSAADTDPFGEDDVDDFHGQSEDINQTGASDYKNDYRITLGVSYVNDDINYSHVNTDNKIFNFDNSPVNFPTNIKIVETNVTKMDPNTGNELVVVFRSFATNIGETDYYQRTYP